MRTRTFRPTLIALAASLLFCSAQAKAQEQPEFFFDSPLGRHVFVEGESVELVLTLRAGPAQEDALTASLAEAEEGGHVWKVLEKRLKRTADAPACVRLLMGPRTTSMLRPGAYTLRASFGKLQAAPYELEIVSALKQTNYPVVAWQHTGYFRHVPKFEGTPGRVDGARKSQGGLHYNVSHNIGKPEDLLRRGIAYLPTLYLRDREASIPEYMGRQARMLDTLAQQLRKYPNFIGINMKAQDEGMSWGSMWIPASAPELSIRERSDEFVSTGIAGRMRPADRELSRYLIWQEFRRQHNLPDETVTAVPFNTRAFKGLVSTENPALYLKWMEFLHGTVTNRMQQYYRTEIDRFAPNILMCTNRYMAIAMGHNGHSLYKAIRPRIYCALDPSLACGGTDLITIDPDGYDWNNEAYEAATHTDMLETQRVRGKPIWKIGYGTQGFGFFNSRQQLLRDCLMPIARGAVPATSESFEKGEGYLNNSDEWPHVGYGNRERYSVISGFLKSYGDMFLKLRKEKDVAILFSHSQDCLSAKERMGHGYSIWQIAVSAWMAHFPNVFISEQDILRGELDSHKVLLLTKLDTALPQAVLGRVQAFIDRGGVVIADAKTALPLKGMERLDVPFDGYLRYMTGMYYDWIRLPRPQVRCQWYGMRQEALKTMLPLKEALLRYLPRLVDCENPHVFLSTSTCGQMKVVFCVNYTPEAYEMKTEEDARYSTPDTPRPVGISSMDSTWVRPLVERLYFEPGDYRIYDMFAQREVRPRKSRGKWVVEADMRALEGRVYVLLPEAVKGVNLSATQQVTAGTQMRLRIEVPGESGRPIAGAVPIEVRVSGPGGEEIYRLYRSTTDGVWEGTLKVAANDPAGTWRVVARELLSGNTASLPITVSPAQNALPEVQPVTDNLIVSDRAAIVRFLGTEKQVAIFLDEAQSAHLALAQKLQVGLGRLGLDAQIVTDLDEIQVGPGPDIRMPLVLMGLPGENRLIEQLNKQGVALRKFGPHYPPGGTALLQHVSSAFAPKVSTILLQATDGPGLARAVDALLEIEDPKGLELSPTQKARCDFLPADFKAYRQSILETKLPSALELATAGGELTSTGTRRGSIEQALYAERIGIPIYAVAFSPDGTRIAVATDARVGPDERREKNLFLLNSNGKLLAKGQAGEHLIGKLAFDAAGERLFASVQMNGTIEVFDRKLRSVKKHDAAVYPGDHDAPYFHVSPDAKDIYRVTRPDLLIAEDVATGKVMWRHDFAPVDDSIEDLKYRLAAFALSGDGSRIGLVVRQHGVKPIRTHYPGNVKTWVTMLDAADGTVVSRWTGKAGQRNTWGWRYQHGHNGLWPGGTTLTLSPDGRLAATPRDIGHLALHDDSGTKVADIRCRGPQRVLFTPDGQFLVSYWILREAPMRSIVDSYKLTFYDVENQRVVAEPRGDESVSDADISPDGGLIVALWWDGTLRAYDRDGKEQWAAFIGTGGRVKFSPDGNSILVGTWAGRVLMLDADGTILWKKELPRD